MQNFMKQIVRDWSLRTPYIGIATIGSNKRSESASASAMLY